MIKVVGVADIQKALAEISANLANLQIATKQLAGLMREYVHVDTGLLQSTIDYQENIAYTDTHYAGHEADRGGEHDYPQLAINAFDIESYADEVVRPW
jgi:hypothetical protein